MPKKKTNKSKELLEQGELGAALKANHQKFVEGYEQRKNSPEQKKKEEELAKLTEAKLKAHEKHKKERAKIKTAKIVSINIHGEVNIKETPNATV